MTNEMTELLPCPFCGERAEFEREGNSRQSCIVECTGCGCRLETNEVAPNCGKQWNFRRSSASAEPVAWRSGHDFYADLGNQPAPTREETIALPVWAADDLLKFMVRARENKEWLYPIGIENLMRSLVLALRQKPTTAPTREEIATPWTATVLADIADERRRQVDVETWTPSHDDQHDQCELTKAAACYALASSPVGIEREWILPDPPKEWPWDRRWWKPGFYRRNLVKSGALIVAEIERWDRLLALRQESAPAAEPDANWQAQTGLPMEPGK